MTTPITLLEGPIAALRTKEIELLNDIASELSENLDGTATDRKRLRDIAQDLQNMFFMVAIIGEFNAGKSTFVNALIGEKLLPMGITPTTEFIELIRYSETAERVPVTKEDGLREWAHPNTGAPGVAIVDTPGTGSIFQAHEKTAKDFLHRSDLVIFLISAKHAFAETERLYLELAKKYGKKIILVVNQVDLLEPSERQEVRRFIEAQVKETLSLEPLIFMISARQALESTTGTVLESAPVQATPPPVATTPDESQPDESDSTNGSDSAELSTPAVSTAATPAAVSTTPDSVGGIEAIKAHLRGVYSEAPPAQQKLLSQLDTAARIVQNHMEELESHTQTVSNDITRVSDIQNELQQQSLGLESRMKEAGASVDNVLEGIRLRGLNFIDNNLSLRKLGRGVNREQLQREFQEVVIGKSLREINDATGDYINAVIDQSRLYWRNVIERLNQLQDLMDQEVGGLDSGIYAEQRAGLQEAIRIAESELKSYSSGAVVADMEAMFRANLNGFQSNALFSLAGVVTAIVALITPGPLVGAAAAPLALPAFIGGAAVALFAGVPTVRYYQRVTGETRKAFNERVDLLLKNYHEALDDLTRKERTRLTQYGNQILTPIFSRLEVLSSRYADKQKQFERFQRDIQDLRQRIQTLD